MINISWQVNTTNKKIPTEDFFRNCLMLTSKDGFDITLRFVDPAESQTLNSSFRNKNKATSILKKVIFANDSTYSNSCFFLILNQNLVTDHKELSILFGFTSSVALLYL